MGVARALCTLRAARYFREHRAVEAIRAAGVFDEEEYLRQNADVAESGLDPILHYVRHGAAEGRAAHPFFDAAWYLKHNPDVAQSGLTPLEHFVRYGVNEERSPHPQLNLRAYLKDHEYCRSHDLNPLAHLRLTTSALNVTNSAARLDRPLVDAERRSFVHRRNGDSTPPPAPTGDAISPQRLEAARSAVANCTTLFSVVIPTWNRRSMIGRAIDSVLAQTYPHYEIVVTDDGSTDGPREYLEEHYAAEMTSGRMRWIDGPHAGVSAARNRGLAAARGGWISYLDSDNTWRPDYLLFIAAEFVRHPCNRTAYAGMRVNRFQQDRHFDLCRPFDWALLAAQNFIDLNVFCHHREIVDQLGGFDEHLSRLVDWELVVRFTRLYPPAFIDLILADYFTFTDTDHITTTEPLQENWDKVWRKHYVDRLAYGSDELRLAYVLWDFPALSQTFVLEEIREMVARGVDVRVYYKVQPDEAARIEFPIEAEQFHDVDHLVARLALHKRNWLHSHFAYPTVTLATYPAAKRLNLPFSFMPHAVDIFHHANRERNQIRAVTEDPLCRRVICHGFHHREFLISQGVAPSKLTMELQAFRQSASRAADRPDRAGREKIKRIVCIGRFIEKKGIEYLIRAAKSLDSTAFEVHIHGYGPLEKRYEGLIRDLAVPHVHLKGVFRSHSEGQRILTNADMLVLPCVEADNGDVDGFPTVFLEAMTMGVPVITTTVSANPDVIVDGVNGILCPPRDVDALAAAIRWCGEQPGPVIRRLTENARQTAASRSGPHHMVDTILDCSARPPLDLLMVTWVPADQDEHSRTLRIIQRVVEYTTTPFVLTIVDNGSGPKFLTALRRLAHLHQNIRVIETRTNLGCGPASNMAFGLARSEFMIYLCSNEAFVARPGWERSLVGYMRDHRDVALAGHLVTSPRWSTGAQYQAQPWFSAFRNQHYAASHPSEEFQHVQGGVYIFRRSAYLEHGGFNERLPMNQCDVELSYYLQSCGCKLGDIPSVLSVTQRTRPTFHARLDDGVAVVHPVTTDADEELISRCVAGECKRCNISGWMVSSPRHGRSRSEIVGGFVNPTNGSTGVSRAIYRLVATRHWNNQSLSLAAWLTEGSLVEPLRSMFSVVRLEIAGDVAVDLPAVQWRGAERAPVDLAIVANLSVAPLRRNQRGVREALTSLLKPGGSLVFSYELTEDAPDACYFNRLARECDCACQIVHYQSQVLGYGLAPLIVWTPSGAARRAERDS